MDITTEPQSGATEWIVDTVDSAEGAVAALELVLAPNAQRLLSLEKLSPAGVVLVGYSQECRFALFWEDGERVHNIAGKTFADACSAFCREKRRLDRIDSRRLPH